MARGQRRTERTSGRRSVTIAQVAERAGVSPSTVSRVMNGRFVGEPEVAERVRRTAAELKYSPSPVARSLALGETNAIALVVPDLSNPAFQAVLSGLSKAASRDGYRVLVADSGESADEEALLAVETRRRCDSIVLCAPRMPTERLSEIVESLQPLVIINRPSTWDFAPSLSIDYRAGILSLARHLYDLGHRDMAFLNGPERSSSNAHRLEALDEFERAHDDVTFERIDCGFSSEDGHRVATVVAGTRASAVLAYNDLVAVGLMNGLSELGVRVPDDISVTGFDGIPFARYTSPPLTTVSVPNDDLGTQAWLRLHAVIRGERPGHNMMFQPRLEVRATTAPHDLAVSPTG
ncbi:MAG: LacI family DNA-binding transcriptional regulator [Actinomycetota bacterium]|nr:LacI family DNA-binding transcriptional regulator [Actinomycetota bacterium]